MKGGAVAADGRIEPGDMLLQVRFHNEIFELVIIVPRICCCSDNISLRFCCMLIMTVVFSSLVKLLCKTWNPSPSFVLFAMDASNLLWPRYKQYRLFYDCGGLFHQKDLRICSHVNP